MTTQIFPGLNRNDQLLIAPTNHTKCGKKDCYFCYQMFGVKTIVQQVRKKQPKKGWLRWEPKELEYLRQHLYGVYMKDININGRSLVSKEKMRCYLRRQDSFNLQM